MTRKKKPIVNQQEPKRLKIGILGGSHAQGAQPYIDNSKKSFFDKLKKKPPQQEILTNPLDFHLSKAMPGFDFINVAISGRGSERYLQNIVQLVDKFSVDVIVADTMANRSFNYFWYNENAIKSLVKNEVPMRLSLMEEKYSSYSTRTGKDYLEHSPLQNISSTIVNNWTQVNTILGASDVFDVLGQRDMENTRILCDKYGLVFLEWSFEYELKDILLETFINWETITCDGHHMNDIAMDWAAKNFFAPKIFGALNG